MANKPIAAIAVKLQQHTAVAYWQVHHKLNAQYAGIVHDFDNLFGDNERIYVPALVTSKVIEIKCNKTGNIINPASLPLGGQQQLEKGEQHDMYLTQQERCSFNSTIPNLVI